MEIKYYRNEICPLNANLFERDEYTFAVLEKILQGACVLTVTDFENFVICYSCPPYPVWVWLPDNASAETQSLVLKLLQENFDLSEIRLNVKYFFAQYLQEKGFEIETNMQAYTCLEPAPPKKDVEGALAIAKMQDLDKALQFVMDFHEEVGLNKKSRQECEKDVRDFLAAHTLFFWKNRLGEYVAMCTYHMNGEKCNVSHVFTKPDQRRRGYAARLVYEVTAKIRALDKLPTLYTDADYMASNACYKSIGYQLQGELCTVKREK